MQNLHFLCQTLILFAKAVQFCRISFLTPLGFSRAKRLNLKPPSFQLSTCYSKLLGYAALRCARLIKPINGACFKLVGICSSMLSHLEPLSWTGVKYPNVREQRRSSILIYLFFILWRIERRKNCFFERLNQSNKDPAYLISEYQTTEVL